jgi:predicted nucleic acid-binding protein
MVAGRALFDTNILIDHTKGIAEASAELSRYDVRAISLVTWIEVMAGAPPPLRAELREFLSEFIVRPISIEVAEEAVRIRRNRRLKLPDALILATAVAEDWPLVTRNTRDFQAGVQVRIPYRLQP